jgi:hypothetical protein
MKKLIFYLTSLCLFGCYNNILEEEPCDALMLEEVRYAAHVYPIIGKSCAIPECHTTGFENGNFNDFHDVRAKAQSGMLEFMITTDQMPHGATHGPRFLTTCEISIIKKWIKDGALNN